MIPFALLGFDTSAVCGNKRGFTTTSIMFAQGKLFKYAIFRLLSHTDFDLKSAFIFCSNNFRECSASRSSSSIAYAEEPQWPHAETLRTTPRYDITRETHLLAWLLCALCVLSSCLMRHCVLLVSRATKRVELIFRLTCCIYVYKSNNKRSGLSMLSAMPLKQVTAL